MSENLRSDQSPAELPRRRRVLDWLIRMASQHLNESWAGYETEMGEFTRLSERPAPGLDVWHGLRAEAAARRAFRAGDTALLDRVLGLRPEEKRKVVAVQQMVDAAFGEASALPLWSGYKTGTFNVHEELGKKTHVLARDLTAVRAKDISSGQLSRIVHMVPLEEGHSILEPRLSGLMQHPEHLATVRNLFVAMGQANAEDITGYRYVRIDRREGCEGQLSELPDSSDFLTTEMFIVGLTKRRAEQELEPVALLSLAASSVEMLAMFDKGIRMEPETELPENSISAITRIHDLVLSDCAMQRSA